MTYKQSQLFSELQHLIPAKNIIDTGDGYFEFELNISNLTASKILKTIEIIQKYYPDAIYDVSDWRIKVRAQIENLNEIESFKQQLRNLLKPLTITDNYIQVHKGLLRVEGVAYNNSFSVNSDLIDSLRNLTKGDDIEITVKTLEYETFDALNVKIEVTKTDLEKVFNDNNI